MSYFEPILDKDGNPTGAHIPHPDWYVPGLQYHPAQTSPTGGFSSGYYTGPADIPRPAQYYLGDTRVTGDEYYDYLNYFRFFIHDLSPDQWT